MNDDGSKFSLTEKETIELYKAMFSTLEIHTWQKDDIMIFDNVLYGHFRMPGEEPRKLHAIFTEEVDTRKMREKTGALIKCVERDATKPCKRAIALTLAQLGAGGSPLVLTMLTFIPDFLFRFLGNRFWVSGKGYNS